MLQVTNLYAFLFILSFINRSFEFLCTQSCHSCIITLFVPLPRDHTDIYLDFLLNVLKFFFVSVDL